MVLDQWKGRQKGKVGDDDDVVNTLANMNDILVGKQSCVELQARLLSKFFFFRELSTPSSRLLCLLVLDAIV